METNPTQVAKSAEPHPDAEKFFERAHNSDPIYSRSIKEAREDYRERAHSSEVFETVESVRNIIVRENGHGIPIRIYVPHGEGPYPVLVWGHAGGWVLGDIEGEDETCRRLANTAKCAVISVEYRLAPEHRFPAALEDYYSVIKWISNNAESYDGDTKRIVVGGQGPGANLAAASSLLSRDKTGPEIQHQVLIIPVINYSREISSYSEFGEFGSSREEYDWVRNNYIPHEFHGRNPYAFPLEAEDFSSLPSASILTAGYDPRRGEGKMLADKLTKAGVDVNHHHFDDVPHVFFGQLRDPEWQRAREGMNAVSEDIARHVG